MFATMGVVLQAVDAMPKTQPQDPSEVSSIGPLCPENFWMALLLKAGAFRDRTPG